MSALSARLLNKDPDMEQQATAKRCTNALTMSKTLAQQWHDIGLFETLAVLAGKQQRDRQGNGLVTIGYQGMLIINILTVCFVF